jgi:outer membrane biosynthesis protein TonB
MEKRMKRTIIVSVWIVAILLLLCGCSCQQQGDSSEPIATAPVSESEPTQVMEPTPAEAASKEEPAVTPAETKMNSPEPELDTSETTTLDIEAGVIEFPDDED